MIQLLRLAYSCDLDVRSVVIAVIYNLTKSLRDGRTMRNEEGLLGRNVPINQDGNRNEPVCIPSVYQVECEIVLLGA